MFCPVCEAEYQPGITVVLTTKRNSSSDLTADNTLHDSSEARFVRLHHLGSPVEAEMVNDLLRQNGIRSVVQSGGADALAPLLSTSADGSVILVDERDLDRAQELYAAFFGGDTTPLTGSGE